MKKNKVTIKKVLSLAYICVVIALSFLYFTNDFGLVDIRKTSVIIGVGIDVEQDEIKLTAQLAVPQPAENGENTQFTEVDGKGATVAEALKEINAKTGFYPKLIFCKLIVLGESCKERDIFALLDYFYRNEYTQLTPIIAMCKGEAGKLMGEQLPFGNTATVSIERLLSDEAKKTGNISTVNLKGIALQQYSESKACYMPYIVSMPQGGQQSEKPVVSSNETGSNGKSQGGEDAPKEFLCNQTAIFSNGIFQGVLSDKDAFALNLLRNDIRHAVISCDVDGVHYVLGLRGCYGTVVPSVKDGKAKLKVKFRAKARLQDESTATSPKDQASEESVKAKVITAARQSLQADFSSMIDEVVKSDCDVLGIRKLLNRKDRKGYEKFGYDFLDKMQVEYDIDIVSAS